MKGRKGEKVRMERMVTPLGREETPR